jgi:site-specific DNA recombinase
MRGRDPGADAAWQVADTYRDAGYSGGILERPSLRRLIRDVEEDRIQVVVVYKIDRLSRSISQFYQVWGVLERKGVDLVSATQDLNTTTSQGKLMLNMLLSFGQFEREQIGERTRDKVAAARRKGRWTGGVPVLGYDVDPRGGRLLVNEDEAVMVREVFSIYLRERSLTRVIEEVERRGWRRKTWTKRDGVLREGSRFDKPSLLCLLRNPLFAGKVHHRGTLHDGAHPAIVDEAVWTQVQGLLRRNGSTGGKDVRNRHGALLRGLLQCASCGSAMNHSFTTKRDGTRYRYYRCATNEKRGAFACPGGSVPAQEVEQRVVERIREIGKDPVLVAEVARQARDQMDERRAVLKAEQCQLGKDLKRERASLRRLAASHGRNGDASGRLAAAQQRIETVEKRLLTVARELDPTKQQTIDERQVANALSAFNSVWEALIPTEQARILGLLTERIAYDGRVQRLELALRPSGIGSLHELQPA